MKRPTIKDVARAAGVSKSTVSLVLGDSPAVREDTRKKVREAIERLGYVYNRSAARLRTARTGLVGLVINDLRNPFFAEFAASLQMALAERGHALVLANTDENAAIQARVVGAMVQHGVDAVVISPAFGDPGAAVAALERAAIPTLQVLRRSPGSGRLPFASPDYRLGSLLATRHLIGRGARRIVFVGGPEGAPITRDRMEGYLTALEEAGLEPVHMPGRMSRAFGRETAAAIAAMHPPVDAALCFNDLTALGLIAGCHGLGLRPGSDIRIMGFDDIEEAADALPPLSTVGCDIGGFGRRVAGLVADWMGDGAAPPGELLTPVELVIRATG